MALKLSEIVQLAFPSYKYFKKEYPKIQIVLHHTVSGEGFGGDLRHWIKSKFNMGTAILVGRRGDIGQAFSSKYWAYHLGVPGSTYKKLGVPYKRWDMTSIGIEIDSYGGLKRNLKEYESGMKWMTVYGTPIPNDKVIEYPEGYRGYYAFEKYTDAQIQAVKDLLIFWNERYKIPLAYHENMWECNADALSGVPGV